MSSPYQPLSLSDKIKELYAIAYDLYQSQDYVAASSFFYLLTVLNPLESKYWKGLGAALQMKRRYSQALFCYEQAQALNENQPDPYLSIHIADCHLALKQVEQGLKVLEQAKLKAHNDLSILNHVALMQELWSNK